MRMRWGRRALGFAVAVTVVAAMTALGWRLGEPDDVEAPPDLPSLPGLTAHVGPARIAIADPPADDLAPDPPAPILDESPAEEDVPAEPVRAGDDGVEAPRFLRGAEPELTEMAVRAGVEGTVVIEAVIDREGRVTGSRVLKPLPFGLDRNALDAVATWRFKPAMRDGRPVACYWALTVVYRLHRR